MIEIIYPSIDDYLKIISEFDIYAIQLSSGNFICRKTEVQLPKLTISNRYVSTSMQYHTLLTLDCFYIVIPRGEISISVNGHKMETNQPVVYTLGQEVFSCARDNSYSFHIVIPTVELVKYIGEESIDQLKRATVQQSFGQRIFTQSGSNHNHLCILIGFLLNQSKQLSYQAVLDTQETIIELLCKLLTLNSKSPNKDNISRATKLGIVNRALNHLNKSSTLNITIPELAGVSFCSLRSLEYAFKSILNMTPKQYLIKRRLNSIHAALKKDSKMPIKEIMDNFGVVNQGRFAQDYFKLFNEYPHQTGVRISEL